MNARRNKRNLTPKSVISEGQKPDKRNAATNTDEQLKLSFQKQTAEIGQASVFNIHIHMPANFARNTTKMYLPRIQPVIHLHFDEHANVHHVNVVKQITPKFKNVLIHYEKNSFCMHYNLNKIKKFNQKQTLREKNSSIELESGSSDLIKTVQKHNSQTTDQSGSNDTNEKTQGLIDGVMVNKGPPVKLKKAIVVLQDICKSNSYKSGSISDLFNFEKNNSANNSESSSLNCVANSNVQIKMEHVQFSPTAETPYEDEKPHLGHNNSYENPFNNRSCPSSVSTELVDEEKSGKRESLASLVEGCNFSEILKKFREKFRNTDEYLEKPYNLRKAQNVMERDKEPIDGDACFTQNSVQTKIEASWVDQSHDIDEKKQEEQGNNKDGVNLQEEASVDGTESYKIENQPYPSSYESKMRFYTKANELKHSVNPSVEEIKREDDQMNGDCEINCSVNTFHMAETESDDCEITTRNKLSSDVVEDLKIVDFDSSNDISDAVTKSEFDLVETNDIILHDEENQYFDSKLTIKKMVPPKQGTSKTMKYGKRNSRDVSKNEPSPKKIKKSPEAPKKSERKAPRDESYIPLKIPGPTKFTVVPLSRLQNCKAHEPRHFKKNMLFGKRVNRFSNPDHLRTYKLKQQSARRRGDQGGQKV